MQLMNRVKIYTIAREEVRTRRVDLVWTTSMTLGIGNDDDLIELLYKDGAILILTPCMPG